jgi:predicted molibdopterin-dependent oxidoreductase YjgC
VLCKKGRFDPLYDKRRRITTPLIRRNGSLEETSWEEALSVAARRLAGTAAGKLGVLTSSQATNEGLYLVRTLFHEELGVSQSGLLNDVAPMLPVSHGTLDQIAHSDLVLVVNGDPARYQPVVSFLIKRAVDKGTRLIVVDGPQNELAPFAQMHLAPDELDQAIEAVQRAESPLVLYGGGLPEDAVARLQALDVARFLALEPGVNTRAAAAYGLEAGFDGSGVEMLYCLLGEQAWDSSSGSKRVPEGAYLVLQTSYESPLMGRADVVLPMAIWSERPGTLTNLEGQVHEAAQAVAARGDAKADWQILSLLGQELGKQQVDSLAELSRLAAQGLNRKENR